MAQQPNVEITEAERPRRVPQPGPAGSWRATKPGVPAGPDDVPRGGGFGEAGPDPGWAIKLVRQTRLPDDDPRLEKVVTGLVIARAAAFGRAAIPEDVDVALSLCGYGPRSAPGAETRRKRWLEATAHESRHGATAVSEVGRERLMQRPGRI
ncbi:MAG: hypothetical protein PVG83_08550 [Acidimicrobiia bacterium]